MSRLNPKDRKAEILIAALQQARDVGFQRMTRGGIARAAGCSDALVSAYFNTMTQMRRATMRAAIANKDLKIVAQGILAKDPQVMKADPDLRKLALEHSLAAIS